MAKYLWHGSYSVDGIRGIQSQGGTARVKAVEKLLASVGGRLESFHFALGKDDYYIIVELPGNVNAAAAAMAVGATGAVSVQTVVLLTPEEIDQATKASVEYSPPGS